MQADDVYRFVALRDSSSLPPTELQDPFIGAYSHQTASTSDSYRAQVTTALTEGDVATARSDSSLRFQELNVVNAWELLAGTFFLRLFLRLPDLVRRGVIDEVEKVIVKSFDVGSFGQIRARLPEIVQQRERVADYLAACSLTGPPNGDFDGAAHLICCFETIERVLAVTPQGQPVSPWRAAWKVPLSRGVVTLPFEFRPGTAASPPIKAPALADVGSHAPLSGSSTAPMSFIGDLIILKQQLRRYELGEIAHVENILAKEHLDRTHRTLRRTETKLLTIEDTEKEVSRDVQSTTRDELSSEIQKTVSEQLDLSVNFNVTATYMGPGITVTGSVGGAAGYRRSSEERKATAMAHSQEVVAKASEKIRERTLTQRERIETEETEQTAVHKFENDTSKHIVGVYRWLERCFDLQLVNYGRRLIYEFVVPEPATFWGALVTKRGYAQAGPPPDFPQLGVGSQGRALQLADFSLTGPGLEHTPLEHPARWTEIVELAGQWSVKLESAPAATAQVHFALNSPSEANTGTDEKGKALGNDSGFTFATGSSSTVASREPMKIPPGYRATAGQAAIQGWRYLIQSGTTYHDFAMGEAHLQLNGRDYSFIEAGTVYRPGGQIVAPTFPPVPGGREIQLATEIIPTGEFLEGEIPVLLSTSLNGLTCSIRLECKRNDAHAAAWSERMFSLFAAAHADRLARYQDDKDRAQLGNEDWAGNLTSQTARDIERRELKRGILAEIMPGLLQVIGDRVLIDSAPATEPDPRLPVLQTDKIPDYVKTVRFFEMAFDWNNLSYIFAQYFYGRRKQWNSLAVADNADPQFKAFLSAGAARVQVPIRKGYETHVTYFFAGLGLLSFEQRVPWLGSMRPIAEDLAADAREGFDLGEGKISVAHDSDTVTGFNTVFVKPGDIDREIRLGGKIYVIKDVRSRTEVMISPPYRGAGLTKAGFELGGIVVGPTFPLKLATTLVAIDKPGLALPEYPGRYAE